MSGWRRGKRRVGVVGLIVAVLGCALVASAAPSGAAGTSSPWRASPLPYTISSEADPVFTTVSCSSVAHCLAGGFDNNQGGALLYATNDAGHSWVSTTKLPPSISNEIDAISCVALQCWAVDNNDNSIARSSDGGQTWTDVVLPPRWKGHKPFPTVVACTESSCLVGDDHDVEETGDDGHRWVDLAPPAGAQLTALACSSDGTCQAMVATGSEGTQDPTLLTLKRGAWTDPRPLPFAVVMPTGLSCQDAQHCTAVGTLLYRTSDGGASWHTSPLPKVKQQNFTGISCATVDSCAVVGFDQFQPVVWFDGPTTATSAGAGSQAGSSPQLGSAPQAAARWTPLKAPADVISSVACTASHCVATGVECGCGTVMWRSDASGSSWTRAATLRESVNELSCTMSGVCLALDNGGSSVVVSTDAGRTWTVRDLPRDWGAAQIEPQSVSCVQTSCYLAGDSQENSRNPVAALAVSTDAGTTWSARRVPAGATQSVAIGCGAVGHCLFVYGVGQINWRMAYTSDSGATWSVRNGPPPNWGDVTAMACQTATTCYLTANFLLRSTDAGSHFTSVATPARTATGIYDIPIDGVTCSAASCILSGVTTSHSSTPHDNGTVMWRGP